MALALLGTAIVVALVGFVWWRIDQGQPLGETLDGVVFADPADCATIECDALIDCATALRWPASPPSLTAGVFGLPTRLRDGTLITRSGVGGVVVVFQLDDGTRHATPVGMDACP